LPEKDRQNGQFQKTTKINVTFSLGDNNSLHLIQMQKQDTDPNIIRIFAYYEKRI